MRILSLLFSALLLAVSCSQEGRGFDDPTGSGYVSFRSSSITRVEGDSWQDGDKVGLFIGDDPAVYQNLKYNVAMPSNEMTPETDGDRVFISSSARNCYAYYPHSTTAASGEYTVDVTDKNDLLWSGVVVSDAQSEIVDFSFSHQLAQLFIHFTVEGENDITKENTRAELLGGYTTAKFDLKSGLFNSQTAGVAALEVNPQSLGATISTLAIPQSDLSSVELYITHKGILYRYKIKAIDGGWESGKSYEYELTAKKNGMISVAQRVAATRVSEINN